MWLDVARDLKHEAAGLGANLCASTLYFGGQKIQKKPHDPKAGASI